MKILIVQESDWLKRGPHQQHHLADRISLRGHQVRVIDYDILWREHDRRELYSRRRVFGNICKVHQGAKVTVIRPGIIKVPVLDYLSLIFTHRKEIERQIKEFSPDVIIGFGILNGYLAVKAARRNNIPFIYYWIDVLHRLIPFKPLHPIAKMVESKALKEADRILAINDKLKDYVIETGASPEHTQVVRAGIDIELFNPSHDGDNVRKQYGLKKDDIVLFFMGWLYHKLLIVGEGDAYDELEQIQNKYNLQDRLILTGKKPYQEIPAFIAASDVCLLPAYPTERIMQDIVPIKIYEYMAMAKPVVSTELPGVIGEFGKDNGVVYVSKPEDAVGKAIGLIQNGSLKELGAKARSFAERYSWDSITDEFEEILEQVVKEKENERIS
jgi:glycosyltransferase involved in cell wall biosynthesis